MTWILHPKKLLSFAFIICSLSCLSQETNKTKILGSWDYDKVEFIGPVDKKDSLEMINNSTGIRVTFKEGNKFITEQKLKDGMKYVESGEYSMTADGKAVLQNGERADIVVLNDEKLVIKIADTLIVHFKRVGKAN